MLMTGVCLFIIAAFVAQWAIGWWLNDKQWLPKDYLKPPLAPEPSLFPDP